MDGMAFNLTLILVATFVAAHAMSATQLTPRAATWVTALAALLLHVRSPISRRASLDTARSRARSVFFTTKTRPIVMTSN